MNRLVGRWGCQLVGVVGLLCAPVWTPPASAGPKVYKLDLTFKKIFHNAEPMDYSIRHRDWTTAWSAESGVEWRAWYLDADFHLESAFSKVTSVGLHFENGFRLGSYVDVFWEHHSRHMADQVGYTGTSKYPLWDSLNVRLHFIPVR